VAGQSITFQAQVTANLPGAGTPTGTVTFLDGTTTLGTGTLSGGIASFTSSSLAAGTHGITASYGGNTSFTGSTSAAVNQTVNQDSTTSTFSFASYKSVFGETVSYSVTVTADAPGSGHPTGTVTFLDGTTALGTGTLVNGSTTFKTSTLSVGTHSISASYGGDSNYTASVTAPVSLLVGIAGTTAVLKSSANPSVFGQSVTITATVSANAPSSGHPTGTVTFSDGTTTLGTGTLNNGVTTLKIATLAVGTHSITAFYSGDGNYSNTTSAALNQTVNPASTTTTLKSSVNPSVFGQTVKFTATVTAVAPASGHPTGTVTFYDGATTLGIGTLTNGVATFQTSALALGTHSSITAVYAGDGNYLTSTSAALSQTVNVDATTVTITSSANPSTFGKAVTFTITVKAAAPGSGTPTGTVTIKDGTTVLGTVSLVNGVAKFTTSSLAVGSHNITATYNGDIDFLASVSAILTQTVK
jgi:hypothetical protein